MMTEFAGLSQWTDLTCLFRDTTLDIGSAPPVCKSCSSIIFWDCQKSVLWLLNLNIPLEITDLCWSFPFFGQQKLEPKKTKKNPNHKPHQHPLTNLDLVLWLLIGIGGWCLHPHAVTGLAFMIHMMTRISWNIWDKQGNALPISRENFSLPNLFLWTKICCGIWFMTAIKISSSLGKIIKSIEGSSLLVSELPKAHQKVLRNHSDSFEYLRLMHALSGRITVVLGDDAVGEGTAEFL